MWVHCVSLHNIRCFCMYLNINISHKLIYGIKAFLLSVYFCHCLRSVLIPTQVFHLSSPLPPSLLCVRAVRVDLPVPLPPSTPADSTTRADVSFSSVLLPPSHVVFN